MAVIDIHTHFLPYQWPDLAERSGTTDWPWLKHISQDKAMLMVGEREFRPVNSAASFSRWASPPLSVVAL